MKNKIFLNLYITNYLKVSKPYPFCNWLGSKRDLNFDSIIGCKNEVFGKVWGQNVRLKPNFYKTQPVTPV